MPPVVHTDGNYASRHWPVAALTLSLLSGAAGLMHQILWTRRLVDVLGGTAGTFSRVLGAFFLGLAIGAWIASRLKAPICNGWSRVAWAELAVAVLALPVAFLPETLLSLLGESAGLPLSRALLPLLLVMPPATAMGWVLPCMIQALPAWMSRNRNPSVWIYAANTLGGAIGIGFLLLQGLPWLGLTGACLAVIGVNLLIAGVAWRLSLNPAGIRHWSEAPDSAIRGMSWETRMLAFSSGFLILALEVVIQHQLAQVTINSLFSSALVLSLVLIALTLAAALSPWLLKPGCGPRRGLLLILGIAAILCSVQPFILTGLRGGLAFLPYELAPSAYAWEVTKLGALAVMPVFLVTGAIFPLLLSRLKQENPTDSMRTVGLLFAWNGFGGWVGAAAAQAFLAPALGLWTSMTFVGLVYAVLFLVLATRPSSPQPRNSPAIPALADGQGTQRQWIRMVLPAGVALISLVCAWHARSLPQAQVVPSERLVAAGVGPEGVVVTLECGPGDWRMLFNNSYTLGGSRARFNQERQALLPLLLHGNPATTACLGVATGSTVAGAALLPEIRRIDAIELSRLVLQQARTHFGPYNRGVFANPRVRFIHDDARWVIARSGREYDVVIGDLFLPWRTGEARLFALEHFQNIRRALKPGGIYCQWLPMFQLTRPQFEAVCRTFLEVFPDAFLIRGDFYTEMPILGLVGGREFGAIDWTRVRDACDRLRSEHLAADPLVRHVEGVAMIMLGPLPAISPGPANTLANAWLEWDAARNILGMPSPWFIGVPCAEFVREIHRAGAQAMPPELREAHDAGQFFLTLEIAAHLKLPALENLRSQIPERLPAAMRLDREADWRHWPMRIKPDGLESN